jgi:SNF2 family DNA or RNA helicase
MNDQLHERIKGLDRDTRKWNAIQRAWELPVESLLKIIKMYKGSKKIHFDFGNPDSRKIFIEQVKKVEAKQKEIDKLVADLNKKKEYWIKWKDELEENYHKYSDRLHACLKEGIALYPHQIVAAMFLNETKSALISHEMGLGKTLASIAYVELNNLEKVFVITPNSLKFNYFNEVEKFTDSKAHIIKWTKNKHTLEEAKYIIVNYDYFNPNVKSGRFQKKWKKLGIENIDAVICDESHKLKNSSSNTYKNFSRTFKGDIFKDGKISKIFLTGTPAPNRAYELYTILNQISPLEFTTKSRFNEYYCGLSYDVEEGEYVTDSSEAKLEELYHKIAPYTHRKRKKEVLTDLPDKIYQKIILEMSPKELAIYNDIEEGVVNEFINEEIKNPLTVMLRLRQYTSHVKIPHIMELIETVEETGQKMVVVDMFKESLLELKKKFGNIAGLHTGDQKVEERNEIVKEFQNEESAMKLFIGSIQTCNYGLTLTAADKLFILTLPFSVGEYDQVADRLHRIGQKNVVNIYPLMFRDTIDDYVYSAIENKRAEIVKVIDNEDYKSDVSESVLTEVIERIRRKHGR